LAIRRIAALIFCILIYSRNEIWFWLILFGHPPGSHTYTLYSGSVLLYVNGGLKGPRSQHSVFCRRATPTLLRVVRS
jgi:hypothetical protein